MNRFIHTLLASTTLVAYSAVPSLAAAVHTDEGTVHLAPAAPVSTLQAPAPTDPRCGGIGASNDLANQALANAPAEGAPGYVVCAPAMRPHLSPRSGDAPADDQGEHPLATPGDGNQPRGHDTPPPAADQPQPPSETPEPPSTKRPDAVDPGETTDPEAPPTPEAPAPGNPDPEESAEPAPPADQDKAPDLERLPADPPPALQPDQPDNNPEDAPGQPDLKPEDPQTPNHSQQDPTPGRPSPSPNSPVRQDPAPAFSQLDAQHASTAFHARFVTPAPEVKVDRIAGQTRIDTATKMYASAPNKKVAVLSTGRSYADGLTGGALAGALHSGIVLTNAKGDEPLEPEVLATFKASGTTTVYVTGGLHVIGTGVEDSLFRAGIEMKRLAGFNRFETADLVAEEVLKQVDKPGPVFIASGSNFPDALVASSAAARLGGTVRLVDETHPYAGTGYCIGGPACAHAPNATKIIGQDRYETAYQLAARLPFSGNIIAVSGKNFPDALAAGALSAVTDATMVLTDGNQVGVPQGTKTVTMVGGANAIKDQAPVKR